MTYFSSKVGNLLSPALQANQDLLEVRITCSNDWFT
uniref:Uncharacterized protein n=1 Tax=Arundo donax TaxID=35708 RepID=A0A0A8ZXZ7_ARUDO